MKRNWNTMNKLALYCADYLINYCDMKELCSDCIFHDEDSNKCAVHMSHFALGESFIEEVKRSEKD